MNEDHVMTDTSISSNKHGGRDAVVLLVGDLVMLLLFVYIGQRDHELIDAESPLLGLLLPTLFFAVPWIITGLLLGIYQYDQTVSAWPFMARSLNTWLVAAPLGLLLRAYVLGRAVIPTTFITAALGFGGLMVLGWRLAYVLVRRWYRHEAPFKIHTQ